MIRIAITAAGVIPAFVVCAPGADLVAAKDLASRQDACYTRWPGHCEPSCIPATIDAFVGR
jgi:hypothetical protein